MVAAWEPKFGTPSTVRSPPMKTLPAMPAPPAAVREPSPLGTSPGLVAAVVAVISRSPPNVMLSATPRPPAVLMDPVLTDTESVASVTVTALAMSTAPVRVDVVSTVSAAA
eukprot:169877-Prorocentrum_minimum.AAC.1